MDLEGALTNRSESKNIRNKKESPSKHEIHDTRTELQLPLSQERDIGSNTQDAAPDVIKIKSLIYPTQENWADSLLGERRKDDCVLPNLGAKKSSFLTSQTGTTMNSIRDYDSHKSHNRSQICLDQNKRGRALQLDGPDSYPPSFAYLEQHDKSSQVGLKLSEYASAMTSRHSVGADSQCEIKNDLESLVKYLTKGDKNNDVKTDSEIGDFEGNTFECRLSTNEAHGRSTGLRSLQESGFVLKERKNQQSKEDDVRILRERSNSQTKKSPWLGGYDISLHQYQPQYQPNRRVLPHSDSSKSRIKYQEVYNFYL